MAKKTSKNDRIHPKGWAVLGIVNGRFQYVCRGCGVKVFAGQPFSEAGALTCD